MSIESINCKFEEKFLKNQKIHFEKQNSSNNSKNDFYKLQCNWSPLTVFETTSINKIHFLFLSTGCNEIFIKNHSNKLLGIITKSDFLKFKTFN